MEEPLPGVLATADHGQAFGEDLFYFTHGHSVGLDQIRVPLLWRPPEGGTPERVEAPVSTLDAAPTLLRAAGLATPSRFEGRPLPSASDAPGAPQLARSIFAEAEGTVAVVSGSHYYSRDRAPGLPIEPSTLTAQALAAAGARVATLSKARPREALPPYEKARTTGIAPVLEPRLSEFLAVRDR